ncbi:MAG: hypothetical protein U9Q20_07735 [Campylobacterota bacterium]|nr:hypothetical protein [Campylobacterota bacterium]
MENLEKIIEESKNQKSDNKDEVVNKYSAIDIDFFDVFETPLDEQTIKKTDLEDILYEESDFSSCTENKINNTFHSDNNEIKEIENIINNTIIYE